MKRHIEKTNNFSVNWCEGDEGVELIDGGTGRYPHLYQPDPLVSLVSQSHASLVNSVKSVCYPNART